MIWPIKETNLPTAGNHRKKFRTVVFFSLILCGKPCMKAITFRQLFSMLKIFTKKNFFTKTKQA